MRGVIRGSSRHKANLQVAISGCLMEQLAELGNKWIQLVVSKKIFRGDR